MKSKPIKDFEDYLISSVGEIYSLKTDKYLRPNIISNGYYQVALCKLGKQYNKYVARLVAQAFIPNPDNKPEVNHKDGDKSNNDVTNLEWVTGSENMLHAYANGLREPPGQIPIKVYDYVTGKFKSLQPSLSGAARVYELSKGNISDVLAGRHNHTGGLTFNKI